MSAEESSSTAPLARIACEIGHLFTCESLLEQAVTHRSYANENPAAGPDNERLEFLGDAVLDLAVSQMLLAEFPEYDEGALTKVRAELVNSVRLAELARGIEIGAVLRLGRGERRSGGHCKDNVLADALEAILGAIFLDAGFEAAAGCVRRLFAPLLAAAVRFDGGSDSKSRLQEFLQGQGEAPPRYEQVAFAGPDHAPTYSVAVVVAGREIARADGRSKKTAEQEAARAALEILQPDKDSALSGGQNGKRD